jgi:hypothetical protein
MCKTTIVTRVRKLLIALWRYITTGVVIEGSLFHTGIGSPGWPTSDEHGVIAGGLCERAARAAAKADRGCAAAD